jgi:FAD/FMN-containing dehydrogenase
MDLTRRETIGALAATASAGFVPSYSLGATRGGPVDFAPLASRMSGAIMTRSSAGYESARRTHSFNPRTDHHPAAIALCQSEDDIARALEFARRHNMEIAVRSGGHDALASSTCDNGLLIDLGRINTVNTGEGGRSARVGPGARAGAVLRTLGAGGLATTTGNNADVGLGGLVLGGGLGLLVASRGAACDNLLSARLLTADGRLLRASLDEDPDLLWALRGGGGNFGIVTELELSTFRSPEAIGGMLLFDAANLSEFYRFFYDFMARAPRELVADALVVCPGDRPIILVVLCHVGGPLAAEADLAPLRRFGGLLADGIRAAPYVSIGAPTPEVGALLAGKDRSSPFDTAPGGVAWRGGSLWAVTEGAIAALEEAVRTAPGHGWMVGLNHHMHGAVCDFAADTSPLPRHRNAITYLVSTRWRTSEEAAANMAWVDRSWTALAGHAGPAYVNYLSTERPADIAASYGPSFARLRQLKRRYDPDNVFHRNRNIPPASRLR